MLTTLNGNYSCHGIEVHFAHLWAITGEEEGAHDWPKMVHLLVAGGSIHSGDKSMETMALRNLKTWSQIV